MIVIRLARVGKKNKAHFKIVIQEKEWSPKSKAIEIIGHYDPNTDPATIKFAEERVKYWLSQGAQPSNTVWNMLVNAKLVTGAKRKVVQGKKKEEVKEEKPAEKKPEETKDKDSK